MAPKLGFIGFGKMAEALWAGFLAHGDVRETLAVDPNISRLKLVSEAGVRSASCEDVVKEV